MIINNAAFETSLNNAAFGVKCKNARPSLSTAVIKYGAMVIGNTFDNPEIIGGAVDETD